LDFPFTMTLPARDHRHRDLETLQYAAQALEARRSAPPAGAPPRPSRAPRRWSTSPRRPKRAVPPWRVFATRGGRPCERPI